MLRITTKLILTKPTKIADYQADLVTGSWSIGSPSSERLLRASVDLRVKWFDLGVGRAVNISIAYDMHCGGNAFE